MIAVRSRSQQTQHGVGAMAVLGLEGDILAEALAGSAVEVAARNSGQATTVAGTTEGITTLEAKAKEKGWRFTKLDLVRYYLAVADGALQGAGGRPNVLVRYPNGTGGEFFFQKRAPQSRPPWIEVVTLRVAAADTRTGSS